jgi:hypothetical protein
MVHLIHFSRIVLSVLVQAMNVCYGREREALTQELKHMWVVAIINNPMGWRRRTELFCKFLKHMRELGAQVLVIECVYGETDYMVASHCECASVRVRAESVLWHKENLINIAARRLPQDARYVAWIDADVFFQRPDVLLETVYALQHHRVVQMWEHAHDLGPDGETMKSFRSFCSCYVSGQTYNPRYGVWHPGYAWAMRMSTFSALGGLLDIGILGAGDHHMALSFIERADDSLPRGISPGYAAAVKEFERRCKVHVARDVGFVPGTILHGFHGSKQRRRYVERWDVLRDTGYDPRTDLRVNSYGVYEIAFDAEGRREQTLSLRDRVRAYFKQRCEDATHVDD